MKNKKTLSSKELVRRHEILEHQLHRVRFLLSYLSSQGDVDATRFVTPRQAIVNTSRRYYVNFRKSYKGRR